MLTLLSPSKSVTDKKPPLNIEQTTLLFPNQVNQLIKSLQSLPKKELQRELKVSESLAKLNYQRYKHWNVTESKPALWLYGGDVYNGLDSFSFSKSDVEFAQKHLAIISGLYGIVRPLDGIRPYRLEMKLAYKGSWGDNLYDAWSDTIANYIMESKAETVLMCASKEYAKAVTTKLPDSVRVLTPRFMQETDDGLKEKGLFAKYARGALARYVIDNKLTTINGLQNYAQDGFGYNKELSTVTELVFMVPKDFSLKGRFTQQK